MNNTTSYDIILGNDYSKNKTEFAYREFLIFDKDVKEVCFLINIFDLPILKIL